MSSTPNFRNVIGLGVAGNFTGHLEQAGEASDFKDLVIEDPNAPKGVFPFYVPADGEHAFLVHVAQEEQEIGRGELGDVSLEHGRASG